MKILLLEDEIMLNESIVEYLEALGHSVQSYFDGLKAFSSIKENSILMFQIWMDFHF